MPKHMQKLQLEFTIIFFYRIILFALRFNIMENLRDREVACSASDRQGFISDRVSGGQCHLIHLTIPRRFSWPSLAYNLHKGDLKPHSFHLISSDSTSISKVIEASHITIARQSTHALKSDKGYVHTIIILV